jgi:8-oxo-dGTP pyrophosphatase MutT (NUDIX family)
LKVCAAAILLQEQKILLGKRSGNLKFYPDVWDLIGGHCETGETLEQTLIRELQEELGVVPTQYTQLAVLYDPEPKLHGYYEYHIYVVTEWSGAPRNVSPDEHSKLGWFEIHEAVNLELAHPEYPALFRNIVHQDTEPAFRSQLTLKHYRNVRNHK